MWPARRLYRPCQPKRRLYRAIRPLLEGRNNLCAGGNETDYHYTGVDMQRDVPGAEYHDFAKVVEGGICPCCGKKSIHISRGIEVGNIFQLGKKYTEPMGMTYTDRDGKSRVPIMGCYGIGVGRLAAAVCEAHHDDYGPIWPKAIALAGAPVRCACRQ